MRNARTIFFGLMMGFGLFATLVHAQPAKGAPRSAALTRSLLKAAPDDRVMVVVELDPTVAGGLEANKAELGAAARHAKPEGPNPLRYEYPELPFVLMALTPAQLDTIATLPQVAALGLDRRVEGQMNESAPLINADILIDTAGVDGQGVIVGIIDSGIDATHPDLADAVVLGRRFLNNGASQGTDIADDNGHGTHMAGIITGNGTSAPRGIAPASRLAVVKALDSTNSGYVSDVARGINWLVDNRASLPGLKFINLSFVISDALALCPCDVIATQPSHPDYDSTFALFRNSVQRAASVGILCVASAGNDGSASVTRAPACFSNILAVGAAYDQAFNRAPPFYTQPPISEFSDLNPAFPACHDESTQAWDIPCFSNRGPCVDLLAPGYAINATGITPRNFRSFGTSQAAAHVTGVLALMQQAAPGRTATDLIEAVRDSGPRVADPLDPETSYLTLDALTAHQRATGNRASGGWVIYE